MHKKVYRGKIWDVNELRKHILEAWNEFDPVIIDTSVKQWRICLCACVASAGGQFEHKL